MLSNPSRLGPMLMQKYSTPPFLDPSLLTHYHLQVHPVSRAPPPHQHDKGWLNAPFLINHEDINKYVPLLRGPQQLRSLWGIFNAASAGKDPPCWGKGWKTLDRAYIQMLLFFDVMLVFVFHVTLFKSYRLLVGKLMVTFLGEAQRRIKFDFIQFTWLNSV